MKKMKMRVCDGIFLAEGNVNSNGEKTCEKSASVVIMKVLKRAK